MLKHLPPILTPDLLYALSSMGHGDDLALVDAHFPASRLAQEGSQRIIRMPGLSVTAVLEAVLAVFPLDRFGPCCAWTMAPVHHPEVIPEAVEACRSVLGAHGRSDVGSLERQVFYEQARQSYALVQTGDQRTYANLLIRKGLVGHD